jgi:hypothetical protein
MFRSSIIFHSFSPICTCLVILLIFTPAIATLVKLIQSSVFALHNFTQLQSNIFCHDSGIEVLPSQVMEMKSLLHTHNIPKYQLSYHLQQNSLILQRITESAWPIKRESESVYHFLLISEIEQGQTGVVIDRKKEVALVYHPPL